MVTCTYYNSYSYNIFMKFLVLACFIMLISIIRCGLPFKLDNNGFKLTINNKDVIKIDNPLKEVQKKGEKVVSDLKKLDKENKKNIRKIQKQQKELQKKLDELNSIDIHPKPKTTSPPKAQQVTKSPQPLPQPQPRPQPQPQPQLQQVTKSQPQSKQETNSQTQTASIQKEGRPPVIQIIAPQKVVIISPTIKIQSANPQKKCEMPAKDTTSSVQKSAKEHHQEEKLIVENVENKKNESSAKKQNQEKDGSTTQNKRQEIKEESESLSEEQIRMIVEEVIKAHHLKHTTRSIKPKSTENSEEKSSESEQISDIIYNDKTDQAAEKPEVDEEDKEYLRLAKYIRYMPEEDKQHLRAIAQQKIPG